MFESTVTEAFLDWDRFCRAYEAPIRAAFRRLPFVGQDQVDDLTQAFFLKLLQKDLPGLRHPARGGRFRDWLFVSIRNFATDAYRKQARRKERAMSPDVEPADPEGGAGLDPDALYALSILHLTLQQLRHHCETTGRPEIWRIFDELILAGHVPGREAPSREEVLGTYPGREAQFLDNRLTTAKRIFRRLLPELIPSGLTDRGRSQERFAEWYEIVRASRLGQFGKLHLAFLATPVPDPGSPSAPSIALAVPEAEGRGIEELPQALGDDELSILLSFRVELPFAAYLGPDDLPGPDDPSIESLEAVLRAPRSRPEGPGAARERSRLDQLRTLAKQLYARPDHAIPADLAMVLYNLATALLLVRHDLRAGSLPDERLERNFRWALHLPWLDLRLRPAFEEARARLGRPGAPGA